MFKATVILHQVIECFLTLMAVGRVPQIMGQCNGFAKILI